MDIHVGAVVQRLSTYNPFSFSRQYKDGQVTEVIGSTVRLKLCYGTSQLCRKDELRLRPPVAELPETVQPGAALDAELQPGCWWWVSFIKTDGDYVWVLEEGELVVAQQHLRNMQQASFTKHQHGVMLPAGALNVFRLHSRHLRQSYVYEQTSTGSTWRLRDAHAFCRRLIIDHKLVSSASMQLTLLHACKPSGVPILLDMVQQSLPAYKQLH
jgi:hypothetical protein